MPPSSVPTSETVNPYASGPSRSAVEASNIIPSPARMNSPQIKVEFLPPVQAYTEADRLRDEEARILSELPPLKASYGGAQWEIEVSICDGEGKAFMDLLADLGSGQLANHHKTMSALQQVTMRAQSGARHAAAVLADAEAERIAAGERRRVVEAQLMGNMGVGIMGV